MAQRQAPETWALYQTKNSVWSAQAGLPRECSHGFFCKITWVFRGQRK